MGTISLRLATTIGMLKVVDVSTDLRKSRGCC